MSRVSELQEQIRKLSAAELHELGLWMDEIEDRFWDEEFEAGVASGKWDAIADKALRDHKNGGTTPI